MSGAAVLHGSVRTSSSSSLSELSSWLERARFTGGSKATSCEDRMRAALMLTAPRLRTLHPAAAAACCELRCLSITLCFVRAIVRGMLRQIADACVLRASILGSLIDGLVRRSWTGSTRLTPSKFR